MSIEAMGWALSTPLGGNQKVLLLGLANHAHPDGTETYPSLDTLAMYAHCDRSTARRNIRKLVADGWAIEDGTGPKGQAKYRLPIGGGVLPPSQDATGGNGNEGGLQNGGGGGGIAVPPEPSINRPSTNDTASTAAARELGPDAAALLKSKAKVSGHIVTAAEMAIAEAALEEFNSQMGADFGLGAHLVPLVGRIRERPSWDAAKHRRLVASAWRIRWWEKRGNSRRPTPKVIYGNPQVFEQVAQDAADELEGTLTEQQVALRERVWHDGRRFEELTPHEQANAREAVSMGLRPWEAQETPAPASNNGTGLSPITAATWLQSDD